MYKRQIQGVTWTGLNDDVEALDKALDAYNAKTGYDSPIHVDAASGGFILPFLYPEKKWDFRLKLQIIIKFLHHEKATCSIILLIYNQHSQCTGRPKGILLSLIHI